MRLLKEIWDALVCIGLITVLCLAWFAWQRLKRAAQSAKLSEVAFQAAQVAPIVRSDEDIGVEGPWPTNSPR